MAGESKAPRITIEASFLLGIARYQAGDFEAAQKAFQMISAKVPISAVWNSLGAAKAARTCRNPSIRLGRRWTRTLAIRTFASILGTRFSEGRLRGRADRFRECWIAIRVIRFTLLLGRCLKKQGLRAATCRCPSPGFGAAEVYV
jgi:hypothetical protein